MATKDRRKLQHIHSSIADKQPTPQSLEVGEIAVNNAKDKEFLSIKNSNDKVVRFSSDSTIIDWIENKEVVPYKGYVRGETGPSATSGDTPTPDGHGSYGITNNDLLNNKSNIIVKINQVAAKKTVKYDRINAAKDLYNKEVNPSENTPTGKTDGAGFFIDMSRYAMIGANPSFSSITVTDKTDLSGNTTIANGDGTGTRTGHTLAIKTTDVTANDTNWTETITNRTSTVTNETDKIATLNESATTRTTVVGTENLTVSGTTTEVHTGNVTITNSANVTATTNGTTTETKVGNITENNSANKQENTTGTHKLYTTGDTCINSQANASFYGKVSTNIGVACDGTKGSATTVYGTTTTISGNTTNVTGATTLNLSGNTINERALTANTNVTSAYTSATTATTVIGTANTSATTATLSGNTLVVNEGTSISAKTPTAYVSGTTLDINETNTDITSCGRISANTNDFEVKQCAANGKAIINSDDIDISGKTFDVVEATSATIKAPATTISGTSLTIDEGTSISAKTPSTTISGTNFTLNETNTTINSCGKVEITTDSYSLKQCSTSGGSAEFEFCNGYTVKSNNISLQQCGSAGTISISAQTQNINGGNLTINESGNTAINTIGTTNVKSTGNTNIETNGANNKVTIQASGTGGDVEVFAKNTLCMSGGSTAALVGTTKTNIGKNCSDAGQTTTLNLNGTTINETGTTVNISGSTAANVSGATVVVSGNTTNISGATTLALSGKTVNVDATDIDVDASNDYCLSAATKANIYGKATNIGIECGGTIATATTVEGTTVNVSGNTTNISGATTLKLTGATINEGGTQVNITGGADGVNVSTTGTGDICLTSNDKASIYGKGSTVVGVACNGTVGSATTIEGTTINISGSSVNVSGTTKISGNTTIGGNLYVSGTTYGLKDLTISSGTTSIQSPYNGSAAKSISIPSDAKHVNRNTLSFSYGTPVTSVTSYDPGNGTVNTTRSTTVTIPTSTAHLTKSALTIDYNKDVRNAVDGSYNTTAAATVSIPGSLDHLSNYDGTNINIGHPTKINGNVSVTGTITASGAIYSSDRNLKENIFDISEQELNIAGLAQFKTYNFKGEDNKMYGIIAQDLQEIGLGDLVYSREDGTLAVDYTSFMILEIARLRRDNDLLNNHVALLAEEIKKLKGEKND